MCAYFGGSIYLELKRSARVGIVFHTYELKYRIEKWKLSMLGYGDLDVG